MSGIVSLLALVVIVWSSYLLPSGLLRELIFQGCLLIVVFSIGFELGRETGERETT